MKYFSIILFLSFNCILFAQNNTYESHIDSDSICFKAILQNLKPFVKKDSSLLRASLTSANKKINIKSVFSTLKTAFGEYRGDVFITFGKSNKKGEKYIEANIDSIYKNDLSRRMILKLKKQEASYKLNELFIQTNAELKTNFADSISKKEIDFIKKGDYKQLIPHSLNKENSLKYIESLPKEEQKEKAMQLGFLLYGLNKMTEKLHEIDNNIPPVNTGDILIISEGEIKYNVSYKLKSKDSKTFVLTFSYLLVNDNFDYKSFDINY